MVKISKYEIFREDIYKLHKKGLMNPEIANEIGIDPRRVGDMLKKMGLNKNERVYPKPNEIQKKVIIANVIGDGCLYKSKKNINYRMNLAHGLKQEKYFKYKYNILKSFIETEYKYESEYNKQQDKIYSCIKFQSKTNPYLTELYNIWYKDGKKIFPKEHIKEIDEFVLALKFFDDGYKIRVGYCICLNDYSDECVKVFMDHMKDEFGIITSKHLRNIVYIPSKSAEKFKNIISKYATEDVLYKL